MFRERDSRRLRYVLREASGIVSKNLLFADRQYSFARSYYYKARPALKLGAACAYNSDNVTTGVRRFFF